MNTFHPCFASHQFGQPPGDGQAQPGTAILTGDRIIGLLKGGKQAGLDFLGNADSGVGHFKAQEQRVGVLMLFAADQTDNAAFGEFDGVGQIVEQGLLQAERVTQQFVRQFVGFDLQAELFALQALLQHGVNVGKQPADADGGIFQEHFSCLDLGEVEDGVDRAEQVFPGSVDLGEAFQLEGIGAIVAHQFDHSENGIHRGADLVAHIGQEGAFGTVGRFCCVQRQRQRGVGLRQFLGAFLNTFFQMIPVSAQFGLGSLARGDVDGDTDEIALFRGVKTHRRQGAINQAAFFGDQLRFRLALSENMHDPVNRQLQAGAGLGQEKGADMLLMQFRRGIAQQGFVPPVPAYQAFFRVGVEIENPWQAVEQRGGELFFLLERRLFFLALGNVMADAEYPDLLLLLVMERGLGGFDQFPMTVGKSHPDFRAQRLALRNDPHVLLKESLCLSDVMQLMICLADDLAFRQAEQLFNPLVAGQIDAFRIFDPDQIRNGAEQGLQAHQAGIALRFGALPGRHQAGLLQILVGGRGELIDQRGQKIGDGAELRLRHGRHLRKGGEEFVFIHADFTGGGAQLVCWPLLIANLTDQPVGDVLSGNDDMGSRFPQAADPAGVDHGLTGMGADQFGIGLLAAAQPLRGLADDAFTEVGEIAGPGDVLSIRGGDDAGHAGCGRKFILNALDFLQAKQIREADFAVIRGGSNLFWEEFGSVQWTHRGEGRSTHSSSLPGRKIKKERSS